MFFGIYWRKEDKSQWTVTESKAIYIYIYIVTDFHWTTEGSLSLLLQGKRCLLYIKCIPLSLSQGKQCLLYVKCIPLSLSQGKQCLLYIKCIPLSLSQGKQCLLYIKYVYRFPWRQGKQCLLYIKCIPLSLSQGKQCLLYIKCILLSLKARKAVFAIHQTNTAFLVARKAVFAIHQMYTAFLVARKAVFAIHQMYTAFLVARKAVFAIHKMYTAFREGKESGVCYTSNVYRFHWRQGKRCLLYIKCIPLSLKARKAVFAIHQMYTAFREGKESSVCYTSNVYRFPWRQGKQCLLYIKCIPLSVKARKAVFALHQMYTAFREGKENGVCYTSNVYRIPWRQGKRCLLYIKCIPLSLKARRAVFAIHQMYIASLKVRKAVFAIHQMYTAFIEGKEGSVCYTSNIYRTSNVYRFPCRTEGGICCRSPFKSSSCRNGCSQHAEILIGSLPVSDGKLSPCKRFLTHHMFAALFERSNYKISQ